MLISLIMIVILNYAYQNVTSGARDIAQWYSTRLLRALDPQSKKKKRSHPPTWIHTILFYQLYLNRGDTSKRTLGPCDRDSSEHHGAGMIAAARSSTSLTCLLFALNPQDPPSAGIFHSPPAIILTGDAGSPGETDKSLANRYAAQVPEPCAMMDSLPQNQALRRKLYF